MKKLPNPVTYTSSNHPIFPPEKVSRNIKYSEINLSRFGAANQVTSGSTVVPNIVSSQGLTVTMESSSLHDIDEDKHAPSPRSPRDNTDLRMRAPTLNHNENDPMDYDKLTHDIESKLAIKEDVAILTEEIKEMIKKGELESKQVQTHHDNSTSNSHKSESKGTPTISPRLNVHTNTHEEDDFKITSKLQNSPVKSGSASTIAKLILAHTTSSNNTNGSTFAPKTLLPSEKVPETDIPDSKQTAESESESLSKEADDNADGSVEEEEEGEDPNAVPTYNYTIPPRAPITPSVSVASPTRGPFPPPHDPPPVCRLTNHRVTAGCTAVVALRIKNKLYVANAGDSRAVLCRGDGTSYDLSIDHKPNDFTEKSRVEAAGGFVNAMGRINGNLNLSRSLGDLKYKQNHSLPPERQIITAEPDVVVYDLQPDDQFMIIGCDGIWDCLTSQEACTIVAKKLKEGMSPADIVPYVLQLILASDTILSKGIGTDNMTLLIVVFKK
jgi:hypothetical protein